VLYLINKLKNITQSKSITQKLLKINNLQVKLIVIQNKMKINKDMMQIQYFNHNYQ
jgi:hypothetical protein